MPTNILLYDKTTTNHDFLSYQILCAVLECNEDEYVGMTTKKKYSTAIYRIEATT